MQKLASECSIHGAKFIFDKNQHVFIRLMWILLVLISFCGFFYYIHLAYSKWHFQPDISMKSRERSAVDFPRPAITVCPRIVFKSDQGNFTKSMVNFLTKKTMDNKSECE